MQRGEHIYKKYQCHHHHHHHHIVSHLHSRLYSEILKAYFKFSVGCELMEHCVFSDIVHLNHFSSFVIKPEEVLSPHARRRLRPVKFLGKLLRQKIMSSFISSLTQNLFIFALLIHYRSSLLIIKH